MEWQKERRANLKLLWVFTQRSNRRPKLYPTYVRQEFRDGKSRSPADPLVIVTDSVQATIQIFAFLNLFRSTVYSAYKRRSLRAVHEQNSNERCVMKQNAYSGVSGDAHWRIFANLELQLISELQSEILIDMIKPLHNKTNVRDSGVLQRDDAPVYF
jgi:hypothetical protein